MPITRFIIVLFIIFGVATHAQTCFALDPATTGVVLLHGKGGEPASLRPLGDALETAGFRVETPELPWSGKRKYDQPFEKVEVEIAESIARLKAKGVSQIVLAGHSLGGDAALHAATLNTQLAAVVLLAPAHFPEGDTALKLASESVTRAKIIIQGSNANPVAEFVEVPSGKPLQLPAPIYLSYYDPTGPSAMSLFAPQVKISTIIWFAGNKDPATDKFNTLVVPRLPPTAYLNRVDIDSDHGHVPEVAADSVVGWLKVLADN